DLPLHTPNYIGGDISAGAMTIPQMLARPAPRWNPYATPLPGVYLCSSSTPPGGGVHGMCGLTAAGHALRREFGITADPLAMLRGATGARRQPRQPRAASAARRTVPSTHRRAEQLRRAVHRLRPDTVVGGGDPRRSPARHEQLRRAGQQPGGARGAQLDAWARIGQ